MHLLRLDASLRTEGSTSAALADVVEQEWRSAHPDATVVRRHLGAQPLPATALGLAVAGAYTPAEQRTTEQREAMSLAAALTDELLAADALLVAAPLYNFGVSQHLKAYVDLVITDPRMGPAAQPPALAGRPAVLVTVRGGSYAPGTPREGWDHATGWLTRILADVWQLDLKVVEREFTLVGVNPALDAFTDTAAQMATQAEEQARAHGRALAAVQA